MTNQEYKKLKDEILVEVMTKVGEQLKPLSETLKILTPNIFKEQGDKFERNSLGLRIKKKDMLERNSLGLCIKKREEIERDGWGRRIKRKLLMV